MRRHAWSGERAGTGDRLPGHCRRRGDRAPRVAAALLACWLAPACGAPRAGVQTDASADAPSPADSAPPVTDAPPATDSAGDGATDGDGGCGNGRLDPGEVCDDGNTVTETSCVEGVEDCTGCRDDCGAWLWLHGARTVERVSVALSGGDADGASSFASLSWDGLVVTFSSSATNLVGGDANGWLDEFVRDRTAGTTTRASVGAAGQEAVGGNSSSSSVSADGRFVAFTSGAANLVAGDTNHVADVFVHDRLTGAISRASVASDGTEANDASFEPVISGDGRYVVFTSLATNLVPDDSNGAEDVFVHDRELGLTERLSVADGGGQQPDGDSYSPSVSADGRVVAFASVASNLVPGDTNGVDDVFVRDRDTGITTRVSVGPSGEQANGRSGDFGVRVSADGRFVAFESFATNLVADDTNGMSDVFVHDRTSGATMRVSVDSLGSQALGGHSFTPDISADGRYVVFVSAATNLVPGDTNGADDVFVHDLLTGSTSRASVGPHGEQALGSSAWPRLSGDGRYVVFHSTASNLVVDDANGVADVFLATRW